jgi:hypothetical protein
MDDAETLVRKTIRGGPEGVVAAERLAAMGAGAVAAIADAIRGDPLHTAHWLGTVLSAIRDPAAVPVLSGLLEERGPVSLAAFAALGASGETGAFDPLAVRLRDVRSSPFVRGQAARALGELGDPRALRPLHESLDGVVGAGPVRADMAGLVRRFEETGDPDEITLAIEIATALAKLGDHSGAPVPGFCSSIGRGTETELLESAPVRADAVRALQISVGRDTVGALRAALRDPSEEVIEEAARALLYLGTGGAADELDAMLQEHPRAFSLMAPAFQAITGIVAVAGAEIDQQVTELHRRWQRERTRFDDETCFRLGKPLEIARLIALLDDVSARIPVAEELRAITGVRFASPFRAPAADGDIQNRARRWWERNRRRFARGTLFKYGHQVDLRTVH